MNDWKSSWVASSRIVMYMRCSLPLCMCLYLACQVIPTPYIMSVAQFNSSSAPSAPSQAPLPESDGSEIENQTPKETATPPPPPNRGLTAWLQVAGAFFLFFNSWSVAINLFLPAATISTNGILLGGWSIPSAFTKATMKSPCYQTTRHRQSHGSVQSRDFCF